LAVSGSGRRWSLLNASPDIRQQLAGFPALHPRPATRDLALESLVLTSAELDHVLGLLILREALSYRIVSTAWVRDAVLEHNAAWRLLAPAWGAARIDAPTQLDRDGELEARLFPVAAKVPTYLREAVASSAETTVGVRITERATGRRLVFVPGLKALDAGTWAELEAAECVFVDGTFLTRDELASQRPGAPDAVAMGHAPILGPAGTLERLSRHPGRRLYIHMNSTNPVLHRGSKERAEVEARGVEIAVDGMELEL
jgi:pyrroloquinoline quinone biosynthesis protein B